jgi:hypothetical protein
MAKVNAVYHQHMTYSFNTRTAAIERAEKLMVHKNARLLPRLRKN